nr:LysR substrate-binding domain-containing protein [Massilia oculi]
MVEQALAARVDCVLRSKHLREGSLVETLADWRPDGFPLHVVYPQNRHLTRRLRVFIDWLTERLPQRVSR